MSKLSSIVERYCEEDYSNISPDEILAVYEEAMDNDDSDFAGWLATLPPFQEAVSRQEKEKRRDAALAKYSPGVSLDPSFNAFVTPQSMIHTRRFNRHLDQKYDPLSKNARRNDLPAVEREKRNLNILKKQGRPRLPESRDR